MIDYSVILTKNYPGKEWSLNGDSYEGLVWLDESQKPTKKELDELWEETEIIIQNENRIVELKKLLSDSDFRMTTDYFAQMTEAEQTKWTDDRRTWRNEIKELENQ